MTPGEREEDRLLLVLVGGIFILVAIAFWPLMTVVVWATAVAVALMPFHRRCPDCGPGRFCRVPYPLGRARVSRGPLCGCKRHLFQYPVHRHHGRLPCTGIEHTGLPPSCPRSRKPSCNDMPHTIVQMMLQAVTSPGSTRFSPRSRSSSSSSSSPCSFFTVKESGMRC